MAVYDTCALTQFPNCEDRSRDKCSGDKNEEMGTSLLAASYACRNMLDIQPVKPQRYCCDNRVANRRFYDCIWDDGNVHQIPYYPTMKNTMCQAGCYNDRYKVTFNNQEFGCDKKNGAANRGAAARCCKAEVQDLVIVHDPDLENFDSMLAEFFDQPVCRDPGPLENPFLPKSSLIKMSVLAFDQQQELMQNGSLVPRGEQAVTDITRQPPRIAENFIQGIIAAIITAQVADQRLQRQIAVWNRQVARRFPDLQAENLRNFVRQWPQMIRLGAFEAARRILCQPFVIQFQIRIYLKKETKGRQAMNCDLSLCDREQVCGRIPPGQIESDPNPDYPYADDFGLRTIQLDETANSGAQSNLEQDMRQPRIQKRSPQTGKPREFEVTCVKSSGLIIKRMIKSRPYLQAADLLKNPKNTPPLLKTAQDYMDRTDCLNIYTEEQGTPDGKGFDGTYSRM
jgi:hypothetical protein